jgi:DNA-directed RNA polymerase subunit RPC12/RpoP
MSNATLIKLAVGVILLSLGLLLFSSFSTETNTKSSKAQDDKHCPRCGREYPKNRRGSCPYCEIEARKQGKDPISFTSTGSSSRTRHVLVGLIVFLVCGTSYLIYRQRRSRSPIFEDEVFHFRCPQCKRKLGFRARTAGKEVMCPGCRRMVLLPRLD